MVGVVEIGGGVEWSRINDGEHVPTLDAGCPRRCVPCGACRFARGTRRHLLSGCQPQGGATRRQREMSIAAKICGLSTAAAVATAVAEGAAFVGFIFYPPSPRAISAEKAAELCAGTPRTVARVGTFVDADDDAIASVLEAAPIDILQFHGNESPARVADAQARFARPVMKAVSIAGAEDVAASIQYEDVADMLLFDAKPPRRPDALPGGNGLAFDWGLIAGRS